MAENLQIGDKVLGDVWEEYEGLRRKEIYLSKLAG